MIVKGSLRAIFFYISGVLSFICFFMMFLPAMKIDGANLSFDQVYFASGLFKGAIGGFFGFLFVLLTGITFIVLGIFSSLQIKINEIASHILDITTILFMVLGVILIFCTKPMFLTINGFDLDINTFKLGPGPLIGGLISILSALSAGLGLLIPD